MPIHTSSNTYSRGIPKNHSSFFLVAQANYIIPSPTSLYLKNNTPYNRNVGNIFSRRITYPWRG
jgi:hypothetical protein